jgi:FixJ family two-component response regulator
LCETFVIGYGLFRRQARPLEPERASVPDDLARAAFEAAERIENAGDIGQPAPVLTAREIECLALLVRGHSDQAIGKALGLSLPTIDRRFALIRVGAPNSNRSSSATSSMTMRRFGSRP